MMHAGLGRWHFWITFVAFNCTFFPMHILGIAGHMRRIYDPNVYAHLAGLQPLNTAITIAAITLGFGQLLLVANIFLSLKRGAPAGDNPWRATTLEWSLPSPPGPASFQPQPTVSHGPYEYSPPGCADDFLRQDAPPNGEAGRKGR
jgi:cytochrome c oxidase subunit 1